MKEVQKIKKLKSQLKIMQGDAEALKIEVANKQREYSSKISNINALQNEIDSFQNDKKVKVSEHAIVRYFERVKGYNIEEIEKEIVTDQILGFVDKLGGNGGYPNKGFQVLMKNYTVTTVV